MNNRALAGIAVTLGLVLVGGRIVSRCEETRGKTENARPQATPVGINLSIHNGRPDAPIDLVAGQNYIFDRIVLGVENDRITSSQDALEWLQKQSSFAALDWTGVRETHAYWRNFKTNRPEVGVFSDVFGGAAWMQAGNTLELVVQDSNGSALGSPIRLSNRDFLNASKQWDFDMVKAEFRHEDLVRPRDKNSAKKRRALSKIVFAIQTDLSKQLFVPDGTRSLKVVWDKKPDEPYVFPIRLISSPLGYGLQIKLELEPQQAVYAPGDTIHATFTLSDARNNILTLADAATNGLTRMVTFMDGPMQNPTLYHEEWRYEFTKKQFAHALLSPSLGLVQNGGSIITPLQSASVASGGDAMAVDFHVPHSLPEQSYGTFVIMAVAGRAYGSQTMEQLFTRRIQVGQKRMTQFEEFGCRVCHIAETAMDISRLIPPMSETEPLSIDRFDECVTCHDNAREGARRLDKYIHLIHMNRDNFPVAKNACVVCHITPASVQRINIEVCSTCHENFHDNNKSEYTDQQCRSCHSGYNRGHIVPLPNVNQD